MSEYVTLPQREVRGYRIVAKMKSNNIETGRKVFNYFICSLIKSASFESALQETRKEYSICIGCIVEKQAKPKNLKLKELKPEKPVYIIHIG